MALLARIGPEAGRAMVARLDLWPAVRLFVAALRLREYLDTNPAGSPTLRRELRRMAAACHKAGRFLAERSGD